MCTPVRRAPWHAVVLLAAIAAPCTAALGQAAPGKAMPAGDVTRASLARPEFFPDAGSSTSLPEAPGALVAEAPQTGTGNSTASPAASTSSRSGIPDIAPRSEKYIDPGQSAPKSSAGDKAVIAVRDAFSAFSMVGWFTSAGYSQLENSSPNYGTDRGAFGQRLGASAISHISQGMIGDSVMAIVFHEDARYYILGPRHNFFHRVVYAATRPIVTRSDSGHSTPNLAMLSGNLAGAAISNLYYPKGNRTGLETIKTFGGSIGGSAIGFVAAEFYGDVIHLFHRDRK